MKKNKLREWVETTRDRPGRGNWGERNSKLREWVETVRETQGRGNWGVTNSNVSV